VADITVLLAADSNAKGLFRPVPNFGLFGYFQRIIDFDTQVADCVFQFAAPAQQLYRADVFGAP